MARPGRNFSSGVTRASWPLRELSTHRYLIGTPAPYGKLADLVPVPDAAAFPVPPGLAADLGAAGMAGWVALDYPGHLWPGETVLG